GGIIFREFAYVIGVNDRLVLFIKNELLCVVGYMERGGRGVGGVVWVFLFAFSFCIILLLCFGDLFIRLAFVNAVLILGVI
ncbi:hypothetical protein MMJ63_24835, partial [Bacillus vallismortis]|nr:hypothetical protein [Bacillus vallismortis]